MSDPLGEALARYWERFPRDLIEDADMELILAAARNWQTLSHLADKKPNVTIGEATQAIIAETEAQYRVDALTVTAEEEK